MNNEPVKQPETASQIFNNESLANGAVATLEKAEEAFGRWMDVELDKLVARWIHLAAPNASRSTRSRSSR